MDTKGSIARMKKAIQEGRVVIGVDHAATEPLRRKYVLAGDYQQFRDYCREQGVSPYDSKVAVFVNSPERMCGYEIPSFDDVIVYGTFWERRDASEIHRAVRERVRS